MAFAPSKVYKDVGDGSIIGCFVERDVGNFFEFSANNTGMFEEEYPHLVWVGGLDDSYRYARVLKTVVYIVVDEDDDGLIEEKWQIKQRNIYPA